MNDTREEIARWRIAYDTVSALASSVGPPATWRTAGEQFNSPEGATAANRSLARDTSRSRGLASHPHIRCWPGVRSGVAAGVPDLSHHDWLTNRARCTLSQPLSGAARPPQSLPGSAADAPSATDHPRPAAEFTLDRTNFYPQGQRETALDATTEQTNPTVGRRFGRTDVATETAPNLSRYQPFTGNDVTRTHLGYHQASSGRAASAEGASLINCDDSFRRQTTRSRPSTPLPLSAGSQVSFTNRPTFYVADGDQLTSMPSEAAENVELPNRAASDFAAFQRRSLPILHDVNMLLALFRRLMDKFYAETFLWMYLNVLLHPGARRTRNRLRWLGVSTARSLEQTTASLLSGFLTGYRESRQALGDQVDITLRETTSTDEGPATSRAARLGRLSVELGVALNPRQMMRSFSVVVRNLVSQTYLAAGSAPPRGCRLYRYNSVGSRPFFQQFEEPHLPHRSTPHHVRNSCSTPAQPQHGHQQGFGHSRGSNGDQFRTVHPAPPPPPPYPGFLLHFLSVLATPPSWRTSNIPDQGPSIPDTSTDGDSYEALLELGDQLGEVKCRGLSPTDVNYLTSYQIPSHGDSQLADCVCVICFDVFEEGQLVRALPCCHEYHAKCVDRWLKINRTCPICRFEITPEFVRAPSAV